MAEFYQLSTDSLDYLQRTGITPPDSPRRRTHACPAARRVLIAVNAVGRAEKFSPRPADPNSRNETRLKADLLPGLAGYGIPVAFLVCGEAGYTQILIGSWCGPDHGASERGKHARILESQLQCMFPLVDCSFAGDLDIPPRSYAGLVLGIPTLLPPTSEENSLQVDHLIRGMSGQTWGALVLAEPVPEAMLSDMRHRVINEMRSAQIAAQAEQVPSPLAEHYVDLLKISLKTLTQAQAVGGWRTAAYLFGDEESYPRLVSVWKSVYSGDKSLPEPLRIWEGSEIADLARGWALPDEPGPLPPSGCRLQHAFGLQTLLSSDQLSAYVHFPQRETHGFRIVHAPEFDAAPPEIPTESGAICLGTVLHGGRNTAASYAFPTSELNTHLFVAGITGSGKTNTMFYLLRQAALQGVPFLVIEPTKAEYRALLNDPDLSGRVNLFTPGDELVAPFRLNPFEPTSGAPVSVHVDLLRSAFTASFGMWTPLPQILERCLHELYADYGWDITTNTNFRLDPDQATPGCAFPTLADLQLKVEDVVRDLGYDGEVSGNMKAALQTRINSLRAGGKGKMLDVDESFPTDRLLSVPTVLELEAIGDDDDKAFMMALLLIRLAEFRRLQGRGAGLHLLVVEEAHRLLANVSTSASDEQANPRGKAVETFANLIAEVREFGQGVVVVDQSPVKLAPDVIRNTNYKIAHRIVAEEDRRTIAGAMIMNEPQARALATLSVGETLVFGRKDDAPLMVAVPLVKEQVSSPDLKQIRKQVSRFSMNGDKGRSRNLAGIPFLNDDEYPSPRLAAEAQRIAELEAVRRSLVRLVQSTLESEAAFERTLPELCTLVRKERPNDLDGQSLTTVVFAWASRWWAHRRGAQFAWSYRATVEVGRLLCHLLRAGALGQTVRKSLERFRGVALELHGRNVDSFPACSRICSAHPRSCLHRFAVGDLVGDSRFREAWSQTGFDDAPERGRILIEAARETMEWFSEVAGDSEAVRNEVHDANRRVCLCFAQQMLFAQKTKSLPAIQSELDLLIERL